MDIVNLVVLLALVEYVVFVGIVGAARNKYGVSAPATTGHEVWERLHRIQVNTTEQLVLFLPSIYLFSHYVSALWAACLGSVYIIGRIVYFFAYKSAPEKRIIGAIMSSFPSYIMVIGATIGLSIKLV